MSYSKKVFSTSNLYLIDYQHIGISIMIDNIKTLFENIFDFRSVYVSTYDKFVAGLQKIPISNQNLKHVVLFGNEGPVIPSLLVDPQSIEQDENVSQLFFNFFKFSNIYSNISSIEVYKTPLFKLKLGLSYIRLNFDIQAFLMSVYQKFDLDMKVYQLFTGVNRTLEYFDNIYQIPLPKQLYDDILLFDPSFENKIIKIYYDHIGRDIPFVEYTYTPKITLQSISDSSDKYGADIIPYYKSSYSVLAEGYVPTVMYLEYSLDTLPTNIISLFPSDSNGDDLSLIDSYLLLNSLLDSYQEFLSLLNQLLSGSAADKYTAETFLKSLLSTIELDASSLTKFTPAEFANLLASILEKLGILTPSEVSEIISKEGCSNPALISVVLLKKLLGLSYDDLAFIVSLFTDNVKKTLYIASNLPSIEKSINKAINMVDKSYNSDISTMDIKDLIATYRKYHSKIVPELQKQFLVYVILRLFAYPLSNNQSFNYSKFVSKLSSKVTKQIENRDQVIQNEMTLCTDLIIRSSGSDIMFQSCQRDFEYKNVIIDRDVDPGEYYSIDLTKLFNTSDLHLLDIFVPNYEFYISENKLYVKGPIKKNTVINVIRFIPNNQS